MTDTKEIRKAFLAYTEMLYKQGIRYTSAYALPIKDAKDICAFCALYRYPAGGCKEVYRKYCDVSKTPYVFRDEL